MYSLSETIIAVFGHTSRGGRKDSLEAKITSGMRTRRKGKQEPQWFVLKQVLLTPQAVTSQNLNAKWRDLPVRKAM